MEADHSDDNIALQTAAATSRRRSGSASAQSTGSCSHSLVETFGRCGAAVTKNPEGFAEGLKIFSDSFDQNRVVTRRTPTETGQQDGRGRVEGIRTRRTRPGEMKESRMIFPAPPNTRFVDARGDMKPMGTNEGRQTHSASVRTRKNPVPRSLDVQPAECRPGIREGLLDFHSFMSSAIEKPFPLRSAPGLTQNVKEKFPIRFGPTGLDKI